MAIAEQPRNTEATTDVQIPVTTTSCCIVGGGPAGMILAYILARQGVPVTLLEQHRDFDRDFRGDTVHPSTLEILDQLGLSSRLHQLPHDKIRKASVSLQGVQIAVSLHYVRSRFPYVMMMPQHILLDFLAEEGQRFPDFNLVMQANVHELIVEGGIVRGVRYHAPDGEREVRAQLTVGADGRFSKLRKLAGMEPESSAPPMDVLWFRLPKRPEDATESGMGVFAKSHGFVLLNRIDEWQIACLIPKGSYKELKAQGLEDLKSVIAECLPHFADRVDALKDWRQVALLSVESNRLRRWYRPGLLLIGDAAHVMSPVGGVGINYAIQDAVVAANVLTRPLKDGRVRTTQLASVQLRRELPTRFIQWFQGQAQQRLINALLAERLEVPGLVRYLPRIPLLRALPGRIVGFGLWRVKVDVT